MSKNLVLLAVLAAVGFVLYKQMQTPAPAALNPQLNANNPSGGAQTAAPGDVFGQVLNIVNDITSSVKTIAQTSARST